MSKLFTIIFICLPTFLFAQQHAKDTVYYLVDTAKVPVKDRMFIFGQEGDTYGYRLTCQCFPWQNDPIFIRYKNKPVQTINADALKRIKLIDIRSLIGITVKYGLEKVDKTVFYFIEPLNNSFIINEAYLRYPIQDKTEG